MYLDDYYDLISLDVVSLFTNVPLDLVTGGIAKRWHLIKNNTKIPYNEFMISLKLIMDSTFFQFDNSIYKQIFGTPMGSPLSPILANIIMCDLEDRAISSLPVSLPFYVRYVDDIVLAAPTEHMPLILNVFNSFHNRLRFTIEYSNNKSINFLDTTIIINNNYIEFNWYRKPTFSGRFLSFFSHHPLSHKKGVIVGLTDRVFKLSHPRFHNENLSFIVSTLLNNGYPIKFIFHNISQRIKFLISNSNACVSPPPSPSPTSFFTIPFCTNLPKDFVSNIKQYTDKRLAFTVSNKLNSLIKLHKDPLPKTHRSNVIYKISCLNCEASYVEQTKRKLATRIKEHRADINKTTGSLSVVSLHRLEGHEFDWNNVSILDEEPRYVRRIISEMLHISKQNHSINIQSDTELLDDLYQPIIHNIS